MRMVPKVFLIPIMGTGKVTRAKPRFNLSSVGSSPQTLHELCILGNSTHDFNSLFIT